MPPLLTLSVPVLVKPALLGWMRSGVDLMLVKPFRLERVLSVLGDALRLRPTV